MDFIIEKIESLFYVSNHHLVDERQFSICHSFSEYRPQFLIKGKNLKSIFFDHRLG